jgi:hypothetical protein
MTDTVEPENKEIPAHRVTSKELIELLGKTRFNSLLRHEWYSKYLDYEKAYRYGRSEKGFIKVDVFPFFREVHKTAKGSIRPETYLTFTFSRSGYRVIQAHQFVRSKDSDDIGWLHLKTWKEDL